MLTKIKEFFFGAEPKSVCSRCGYDEFLMGPEGGARQMIECAKCGKMDLYGAGTLWGSDVEDYYLTNLK